MTSLTIMRLTEENKELHSKVIQLEKEIEKLNTDNKWMSKELQKIEEGW